MMKQTPAHIRKTLFAVSILCLLLAGPATICSGAEAQANPLTLQADQLAVMPFLKGGSDAQKDRQLEKTLDCQLLGLCFLEEELLSGAEETVTKLAQSQLRKKFGDKVVSLGRVMSIYATVPKNPTDTPREVGVRLGRSLRADYVLVGLVWRFQERVGSALAADKPASVAFTLFLIDVKTGQLIWKDSFDKTQTALTENLFDTPMFLQKGMRWLTAEELSSYGIQKMIATLPVE